MIPFVDPETSEVLEEREGALFPIGGERPSAPIVDGIPRFVDPEENYAESFGWQWKRWTDTLSDARRTGRAKRDLILSRTHFEEYPLEGKTILECGMGGGDDTEILLELPFSEIHAFDLSTSVTRARAYLGDPRLVISQASIYRIPYADEAFDFVFCHRVLQHTPDPAVALRSVCAKVKPGGVLFAHCYKRSWRHLLSYKYKYRWLSKRLPREWVFSFVDRFGARLHDINAWASRGWIRGWLAYNFVPFGWHPGYADLMPEQRLDLEKLNTFDALTPRYDRPMSSRKFRGILEERGFRIEHMHDPPASPLWCTAVKT
jgi:SAM-dependent methyltransferase